MGQRTITITLDEDVFEDLQERAKPRQFIDNPNSVLREILGPRTRTVSLISRNDKGHLDPLMEAGLLTAGQRLTWRRRNLGELHTAFVTDDGGIRLMDGTVHRSPSGAAKTAAGVTSVNGWGAWCTDEGSSLDFLRAQI